MALFGKKKEAPLDVPEKRGPPVDLVLRMRGQGLNNNQIIQSLQLDGYKSFEIFDAMNQADLKGGVETASAGATQVTEPENPAVMEPPQYQEEEQTYDYPVQQEGIDKEQVEEIVEALIEEKWSDLVKDVKKVVQWKESMEQEISQIDEKVKAIEKNFSELHRGVLGRIGEYDTDIKDMGTDIKALNKVFEKILPTLTDNVNQLSRITTKLKKK